MLIYYIITSEHFVTADLTILNGYISFVSHYKVL